MIPVVYMTKLSAAETINGNASDSPRHPPGTVHKLIVNFERLNNLVYESHTLTNEFHKLRSNCEKLKNCIHMLHQVTK